MGFFRGKLFALLLWVILFSILGYYYYSRVVPCAQPIHYKIGMLDPRFGVSTTTFLADIDQAQGLWSTAVDKKLFVYDPKGSLTVNLVYDNRQAITQQENALNSNIDQTNQVAQSVKDQYTTLHNTYNTNEASYNASLATFNEAQGNYNTAVQYWNNKGGAPPKEYAQLQSEKATLDSQRATLNQQRQQLTDLAGQINALIDKYNLLAEHINQNVDAINNDGLAGTQFEEGVYISDQSGTRINIYQFNSKVYFIRVLAHELGHSLGLEHNSGTDSIMSPVNQSKSLALSAEDLAAIKTECGIK